MTHRGQCVIEHRVEQMNPLISIGLRQAEELSVQCLRWGLLEIDQDEEQLVFDARQRTIAIDGVGPANAVQTI